MCWRITTSKDYSHLRVHIISYFWCFVNFVNNSLLILFSFFTFFISIFIMSMVENMKDEKKYYPYLDIIRIISCLGVLFYHLGYLKGGFLSVCCFFVLSGYLSYISLSRKDTVHLKEYYKNHFFHIYLPLLIVVFLTTCVVSFIPNIHWFQLKPETTSVLFGYNNYWQLSVNSDYFARHISSPFMHFWYIGILLQFELIFHFFFLFLKNLATSLKRSGHIFLRLKFSGYLNR